MKKTMIKAINPNTNFVAHFVTPTDNVEAMCNLLDEIGAEYKPFEVAKMPLTELPDDVQDEVKQLLKAYSNANVVFEYNRFEVSASVCIKALYNHDHFVCGRYSAEEVYTKEQRRQNYFESFGYYPCFG